MGVRGLQSFLKNNPELLAKRLELQNTSLVIDANNLLCSLYCNLCMDKNSDHWRNDIYGGDMVAYGEAVKEFFASLDKCNITPVLIFDGSVIGKKSTQNELVLKDREVYRRCLDRFMALKDFMEDRPGDQMVMPQTISRVFKAIVSDLGIQRIQSPYEADTHIARISNDLNCPVLTNDSDFLIYPLKAGFIMLDSFHYKTPVALKQGFGITCLIYSQARLAKQLPGLQPESMPLVSILLGNDYVESGTFDKVLSPICDRYYQGTLKTETRNHRRVANLLEWLRYKSFDEAIEIILNQLHQSNREKLRKTIRILMRNYKIELADNFEAELNEIYPPSKAGGQTNPELLPATYLRHLFESKDLGPIALDIVFHNTHYNYAVVDDRHLNSAQNVKYRPFSLLLALLRTDSYAGMTTYQRKIQTEKDSMYMFDRINEDYQRLKLVPMESLENFGSLEHLNAYLTITLEPELKKSVLQSAFRFNSEERNLMEDTVRNIFEGSFVQESTTCFMLVKYIGLETRSSPKAEFVDALTLTLFYYAALNNQLNQAVTKDCDYGKLLLNLRPHSIKNNGRTYDPSQPLYRRIAHFISQLQSAYVSYCLVNSVLNHVYQAPRYEKYLNTTLIYRLTKLMRLGQLKLDAICAGISPLLDACNTIKLMLQLSSHNTSTACRTLFSPSSPKSLETNYSQKLCRSLKSLHHYICQFPDWRQQFGPVEKQL